MSQTARLSLPFILPGQAQKELFHNEALQKLDALVQPVVEDGEHNTPPNHPIVGQSFLVGAAPTGDWSGQPRALASYTEGGWRFVASFEGLEVTSKANGLKIRYTDSQWKAGRVEATSVAVAGQQVLGSRYAALRAPEAGAVVDQEARNAINGILAALRHHGLIAAS